MDHFGITLAIEGPSEAIFLGVEILMKKQKCRDTVGPDPPLPRDITSGVGGPRIEG